VTDPAATLAGRKALVTGGASGIGEAVAAELAARGAHVTVADVAADAAQRVAERIGGTAWAVDLSDTTALDDLSLDVDILVNNAGIQHVRPIQEFEPDAFRRLHAIMLVAPFLLMRAALPGMYARGWGRIVNISSVHGLVASPYKSAYVSAKHGLEGLSKVAALEGGPHGVTSVCVNPGYVRTPLVQKQIADQAAVHGIGEDEVLERVLLAEQAVKRLVEPHEVASLVGWLTGPDGAMVSGGSWTMDGGWSANVTGKVLAMWLPIMLFFYMGFEHSIVNMFLFPVGLLMGAEFTLMDYLIWNEIPTVLGNLVGGLSFVGLMIFATHGRTAPKRVVLTRPNGKSFAASPTRVPAHMADQARD
jgi:3-hydroxybutyrate dehydrogenase